MATRESDARTRISLDYTQFERASRAVTTAARAMSAAIKTAFAAAGVAVLAAFGASTARAIVNSAKAVLDLGENMANAGKRAGLAAGQFYLFHNAIEKGLSLKTVAGLLGENAGVLNRSATTFRDVSIKLWAIGEKIRGFWLGLMERLAPVLSRLLDGALASNLVRAGQRFGEALNDAIATVYQLAEDGRLWGALKLGFEIAFKYAGERLVWLGRMGYDVLKYVFSQAFVDGVVDALSKSWAAVKDYAQDFGTALGLAFYSLWTEIVALTDGLLNKFDDLLNKIGLFSDEENAAVRSERAAKVASMRQASAEMYLELDKRTGGEGVSFTDKLDDIFSRTDFSPSFNLSKQIEDFKSTIGGALTKYKSVDRDSDTKTYENNNRRAAFGVDSLAAIGGGGNVYLGLSVLEVQQRQLQELRDINRKMDYANRGTTSTHPTYATSPSAGVTRGQTSGVITP